MLYFDEETLEILKPMEWEKLSKMSKDEMQKHVYKKISIKTYFLFLLYINE